MYKGKHVVGSLYDAKEPSSIAVKPDGEWNTMVLTCKGPHIKVVLNGVEIGGGSVRIHDSEIQGKVFDALGIDEEEKQAKLNNKLKHSGKKLNFLAHSIIID